MPIAIEENIDVRTRLTAFLAASHLRLTLWLCRNWLCRNWLCGSWHCRSWRDDGALHIAILCLTPTMALFLGSLVAAQESDNRKSYTVDLLADHDLSQWHVSGCEVELDDGVLRFVKGDGFVRSLHPYQDFVLRLEWKALKPSKWDSGIYVRADIPEQASPWPKRYQINLKQGSEGELIGAPRTDCARLVKPGEWNQFKLTAVGNQLSLSINGHEAWRVESLEATHGFVGLQAEVPLGGVFEFRNITIEELDYQSLFNGHDLTGWKTTQTDAAPCWTVRDERLVCTGKPGSWLRHEKTWDDFNLRLEYRLKPAGNSGVYIRVPQDGNHHGAGAGIEVQILDDQHPKYQDLKPYQYSGSLYAIEPAKSHPGRDPGSWNQLEIDCRGQRYQVRLNGVEVIHTDAEATAALSERRISGFIGLQNHQEEVEFRRLRIGPAAPSPDRD